MHLLGQIDPKLLSSIEALSAEQALAVIGNAVRSFCSDFSNLEDPLLNASAAIEQGFLSEATLSDLRSFAKVADAKYVDLKDSGSAEKEWSIWFYKARIATAIELAYSRADRGATLDAIYELCFAKKKQSDALQVLRAELGKISK